MWRASVIKPFQFPIPRYDDAVSVMSWGAGELWIIGLDARQGYHQVAVRKTDREQLAFFAPVDRKYCFNVMPVGPNNAPHFIQQWWRISKTNGILFLLSKSSRSESTIIIKIANWSTGDLDWWKKNLVYGSKTIIDYRLLWCGDKTLILLYFRCVCEVFLKYRVTFRLDKCDFSKIKSGICWSQYSANG